MARAVHSLSPVMTRVATGLLCLSLAAGVMSPGIGFGASDRRDPEDRRVNITRIRPVVATLEDPDPADHTFELRGWHGTVFVAPRGTDLSRLEGRQVRVSFDEEGNVETIRPIERTG